MVTKAQPKNIVFLSFFLLTFILALIVVWPFLTTIFAGAVIAYMFYPLYSKLKKYIQNDSARAAIVTLVIILTFTIPLLFAVTTIYKDANAFIVTARQKIGGNIFNVECAENENTKDESYGCRINELFEGLADKPMIRDKLQSSVAAIPNKLLGTLSDFIVSIPKLALRIFILFFIVFYLLKDGKRLYYYIWDIMPFHIEFKTHLIKQTKDVIYATVYGNLLIALMQGILAAIAYLILGSVSSPIFWGLITAFAALLPYVGSAIVWLPISVMQILTGHLQNDNTLMTKGFILLAYGALVISTIDNVLKPKVIGERGNMHPISILLGVLGGLTIFGFIGIVLGPLIIAIFISFLRVYSEE